MGESTTGAVCTPLLDTTTPGRCVPSGAGTGRALLFGVPAVLRTTVPGVDAPADCVGHGGSGVLEHAASNVLTSAADINVPETRTARGTRRCCSTDVASARVGRVDGSFFICIGRRLRGPASIRIEPWMLPSEGCRACVCNPQPRKSRRIRTAYIAKIGELGRFFATRGKGLGFPRGGQGWANPKEKAEVRE